MGALVEKAHTPTGRRVCQMGEQTPAQTFRFADVEGTSVGGAEKVTPQRSGAACA